MAVAHRDVAVRGLSRSLPRKALMVARSLRHARRRKPHPEISIYQCAHGRIAVRIFLAQPTVDSRYARRSRGKGHAFAEDCAIIRDGQVQTRRETIEPFPRVGAEGLHGLWPSSPIA